MILFDQIVYGPVHSRRLGMSLGINLSPADGKRCTFDCLYCECGLNAERKPLLRPPSREEVKTALSGKLSHLKSQGICPDRITFSGNGEPTMHVDFPAIIEDTLTIRDELCPTAKVAVLSNSTMLHQTGIVRALDRIDEKLMKLDAATDELIGLIDQPVQHDFNARKAIEILRLFDGKLTVQTMFLKGEYKGVYFDNTCDENIDLWIEALRAIHPEMVMIYTISRETPVKTLRKIPLSKLQEIADSIKNAGFQVVVAG